MYTYTFSLKVQFQVDDAIEYDYNENNLQNNDEKAKIMQTLQVNLAENQYQRLADTAEVRGASMIDLVIEAIEAFLSTESLHNRYTRLIDKQTLWDQTPKDLDAMRLDLIYHSEALEGSPLTKSQVKIAIQEQSSQ